VWTVAGGGAALGVSLAAVPAEPLDRVEAGLAAITGLRAGMIELMDEIPPIIIVLPPCCEDRAVKMNLSLIVHRLMREVL
jgi:hypothetical protein